MSNEITPYKTWEHAEIKLEKIKFPKESLNSKYFSKDKSRFCFQILNADDENYLLKADYYIGVDWLRENHSSLIVAPKLDSRIEEVEKASNKDKDIEIDPEFKNILGSSKVSHRPTTCCSQI